ncbi:MAG: HlyD family efflux transporter periplasmic adaptor subunit [Deltaproteobacteria bacterium]|nr:HlyD family efflux transporter periplasmic adaptor subunit [Deltaproteobacteria bacterium]
MPRKFASALAPFQNAPAWSALAGGLLLFAWTAWFLFAKLSVYAASHSARLEVDTASNPVDAPVSGRVLRSDLVLGAMVKQGDVLVQLDAEAFSLALAKEAAHLAALEPQINALRKEMTADERAAVGEGVAAVAAHEEAEAMRRASEAVATLKTSETSQLERLRQQRIVAELESSRMKSEAEQRVAEAEAARTGVKRLGGEVIAKRSDRRARLARIELEIAQLEAMRAESQAHLRTLGREVELRTIRAPVSGRLGDVRALRAGAVVEEGTRLAVVVPQGGLRVVAFFDPQAAVGRIKRGQTGRVRLLGFPWTKYGALAVRVTNVGSEPNDGLIRVELDVSRTAGNTAPLEHGLPGLVEVKVEQTSPLTMVLDAAGRFVTGIDAQAAGTNHAEGKAAP